MSNWKRLLTNENARERPESELAQILCDYFREIKGSDPSLAQESGLREVAEWIREGQVTWTNVQRAIDEDTWNPAEGARAIYGPA